MHKYYGMQILKNKKNIYKKNKKKKTTKKNGHKE